MPKKINRRWYYTRREYRDMQAKYEATVIKMMERETELMRTLTAELGKRWDHIKRR